jgi:hypothetical protein
MPGRVSPRGLLLIWGAALKGDLVFRLVAKWGCSIAACGLFSEINLQDLGRGATCAIEHAAIPWATVSPQSPARDINEAEDQSCCVWKINSGLAPRTTHHT